MTARRRVPAHGQSTAALVGVLLAGALLAACAAPAARPQGELTDLVGLWQFPKRLVWVQVDPDGSAWQCRVDTDGSLITSHGRFVAPDMIAWDAVWSTDVVFLADGALHLRGKYGEFAFPRAEEQMNKACAVARRG